ncbi:hypothetical protein ACWEOE_30980 [Amycolatopsis sp. NPDC004368]
MSSVAAVTEAGIVPMRSTPERLLRIVERSWRRLSHSARIRCAHSSTRSPSGVRPSKRRPRRTTGEPSSCSSFRIAADSDGCET